MKNGSKRTKVVSYIYILPSILNDIITSKIIYFTIIVNTIHL